MKKSPLPRPNDLEALLKYFEDTADAIRQTLAAQRLAARLGQELGVVGRIHKASRGMDARHEPAPTPEPAVPPPPTPERGAFMGLVLQTLHAHRGTMTEAALSETLRAHHPSGSRGLGRLVGMRLIARKGDRLTLTATGRKRLGRKQPTAGKTTTPTATGTKVEALASVLGTAPMSWAQVQAIAKERGVTISPQTLAAARRYKRVTMHGTGADRTYTWNGAHV